MVGEIFENRFLFPVLNENGYVWTSGLEKRTYNQRMAQVATVHVP